MTDFCTTKAQFAKLYDKNKHLSPKTDATTFDVEPTHAVLTAFATVNRNMKAMRCMNVDRSLEVCCQHKISHLDVSWACYLFSFPDSCQNIRCGPHGHCVDGHCRCDEGYTGDPNVECSLIVQGVCLIGTGLHNLFDIAFADR